MQNTQDVTNGSEKVYSVAEFIRHLNAMLTPEKVIVQGEVGQVNDRQSYSFFTLQDKKAEALINCFVRQHQLESFGVDLKEGLELKVGGFPRIYERTGRLTFGVEQIGLVGEGALKLAFEKLKAKLKVAGYFAVERKRPLPPFVASVGLITSQTADAKTDFLEHLGSFGFKIYFYDVRVEGMYATDEIVAAINYFNQSTIQLDALVLTRGGGSLENLQAFNTEAVAKAVFSSRIPIMTGIGHEADITIADMTADVRASTPTDVARIISDPWRRAARGLVTIRESFVGNTGQFIKRWRQRLDTLAQDLADHFAAKLEQTKSRLHGEEEKLKLASPIERLKQGYSIIFDGSGKKVIRSINQLKLDDIIRFKLFEGSVASQVKELSHE